MTTALIVTASITAYASIACCLAAKFYLWRKDLCGCLGGNCGIEHNTPAFLVGIFWPVSIFVFSTMYYVDRKQDQILEQQKLIKEQQQEQAKILREAGLE